MIYKVLSTTLIVSGIILNEWVIKFISNYEVQFDTVAKSLIILSIQVLLILTGIYVLVKKKKAIQNLILLSITSFIIVLLLEATLSIPFLQDLSSDDPIWIPYKSKQISININKTHHLASLKNKYGFNDNNHSYVKKNSKQIRIAVLGDSFIWGAGVPDSVIWTRKLQKFFASNGFDCEILNWGKSGWSTLDQYNFLREEGHKYYFDYLIFAFVVNDPVMDSSYHKQLFYPGGFIDRNIFGPLSFVIPNAVSFFTDLTNNFLSTYFNYGYINWLNNDVYADNNLKKYSNLLRKINKYCQDNNINFSFIMTPENHNPILEKYFNQILKLLNKNNIPCYDLYPIIESVLKGHSIRELWASPSDGHPGNLVTDIYAQYTFNYLLNELKKQITSNYSNYF